MNKMNKKIKVVLTLSLILNIFLIGFIGGQIYKLQHHKRIVNESRAGLSSDTKVLMRETFKNNRKLARSLFREANQKKKALIDIFTAEEFDEKAYDMVAEDLLRLGGEISKQRLEIFKELAVKLPQDERQALSKIVAVKMFGRPAAGGGKFDRR